MFVPPIRMVCPGTPLSSGGHTLGETAYVQALLLLYTPTAATKLHAVASSAQRA